MDAVTHRNKEVSVIGVGASAGGLEAVSQLLSALEPDLQHALVILQHLSPNYKSMMAELLTRETRLMVRQLEEGTEPEAGTVYVVPPNKNAVFKQGRLHLFDASPEISPKPSINEFFFSLAAELGEKAIGIVLSGTGSDGTAGLQAIQRAGGMTIVQTPESAKYEGMPCAAIDASAADFVLSPNDIAEKLAILPSAMKQNDPLARSTLEGILQSLKQFTDLDFSGYKAGTLSRRVRRRMVATGLHDMDAYADWAEKNPEELDALAKDILISVTAFFRDFDSFEVLSGQLKKVLDDLSESDELRVWVAGCATGEEAYSLAIQILEHTQEKGPGSITLFATDIDEDALNVARQGVYPKACLNAVPEALIEKYFFESKDGRYEVNKKLRDIIVFARHNVIDDPPFLRLNLITCRNVLIYFDNPLQNKVLKRFHFSLKERGLLFLGRSESVGQAEQLFAPVNRRERLYIKSGEPVNDIGMALSGKLTNLPNARLAAPRQLLEAITEYLHATAVLCTLEGKVLQSSGEVNRFFQFPSGSADLMIADTIVDTFKSELLALLFQLKKTQATQYGRIKCIDNQNWQLSLSFYNNPSERKVLVLIRPAEKAPETHTPVAVNDIYEDELQVTREQLQSLIEELATANEEMQSLNEESQASNEELQATNEELEAANEELQATNEELISLNEELSVKTTELSLLNEEYSHLYDSFDFPVLVFDKNLHLLRFNSPASAHINLKMNALHNSVSRLKLPDYLSDLEQLLGAACVQGDKQEQFVEHYDACYQLIISPGLDHSGQVQFLVVNLVNITEIQNTRHLLSESENRMHTMMENTTIMISMKDLTGRYIYANQAFKTSYGLEDVNITDKTDFDIFPDVYAAQIWSKDLEAIRKLERVDSECEYVCGKSFRTFHNRHLVLRDQEGKPQLIITESEDITLKKVAENKLKIAAKVFQQAGEAIVVTDRAGVIQSINEAFSSITGYSELEAVGYPIGPLLNSGRHSQDFYAKMWDALSEKGYWQGEIWNKRKNGDVFPEWLTINSVQNEKQETESYIAVFSDITNLKESQRKVEFLATHDALTGLPNRTLFIDRLDRAVARCKRDQSSLAVMFLDLDGFKAINDTLGHDIGDKLLVEVSKVLQVIIRDVDTVSRLGGDEFTIILNECEPTEIQHVADRILSELNEPIMVADKKLFASASIGISVYPMDGQDSVGLLKSADTAMYQAKESGRNCYQFFHTEMRAKLLKQSALEASLKGAIRKHQFRLVYQPQFSATETGTMTGAEALLRWYDPQVGDIAPTEFIPIAEKSGFIVELGNLVVEMLVEQVARWLNSGLKVPEIALNLSARNLQQDGFVEFLTSTISNYMVPRSHFKIEITEAVVMEQGSQEVANLFKLREAGFKISLDDFGTGYSSLSYLKALPLSELKIDKSFIDGLGDGDSNDRAISKAILSMSKALDLDVVAEGVETENQMRWLQKNGCDRLQGFLLGRPMEVSDFERMLILK